MNESTDYHFRVKASDRGELRRVLRAINVMQNNPEAGQPDIPKRSGDAWYEVGRIADWQDPTKWARDPVSGEAFWHYNLRTSINVRRRIKQLVASGDPDALILDSARGRFFSKVQPGDIDGVPSEEDTAPDYPKCVWL